MTVFRRQADKCPLSDPLPDTTPTRCAGRSRSSTSTPTRHHPADIVAAHVTIRAVQLAFRRHLDTTPADYLRRVRLDRARHDLIAADPARDSITAVAYR